MRFFWFVFFMGMVLFYFADQAAKIDTFTVAALINNLYHFLAGFIFVAWLFRSDIKNKFKAFFILLVGIFILDEIYDYFMSIKDFNFILHIYHLYLILWGAVSGLVLGKYSRNKQTL